MKKMKKNKHPWIQQIIANVTLLHMIRLILLAMVLTEINAIQKKRKPPKKNIYWAISTEHISTQNEYKDDSEVLICVDPFNDPFAVLEKVNFCII